MNDYDDHYACDPAECEHATRRVSDDLVPTVERSLLINPALARFLRAPEGTPAVVQISGRRYPIDGAFYDDHDGQIVLHVVGDPG